MAATARTIVGTPMLQYLNTLTIAANKAISDTGVTAIFIMDNADVDNKGIATKPLCQTVPQYGRHTFATSKYLYYHEY